MTVYRPRPGSDVVITHGEVTWRAFQAIPRDEAAAWCAVAEDVLRERYSPIKPYAYRWEVDFQLMLREEADVPRARLLADRTVGQN